LKRLRKEAPDIATQVADGKLKLNEAIAALNERLRARKDRIDYAKQALRDLPATVSRAVETILAGAKDDPEIKISAAEIAWMHKAIDDLAPLTKKKGGKS
jgi:hypothetical protein